MNKKILAIIGMVGGLGLALLLLLYFLTPAGEAPLPEPTPAVKPQGGGRPALESLPPTATPDAPPAIPAATEPPVVEPAPAPPPPTVPTPEPASQEPEVSPSPQPKPQAEHGLPAGRYRRYGDAKKRLARITKQNLPAFIRKNGKYFEVWAGPFATPQEAARAQKSLKASLKISAKPGKLEVPVPK